MIEKFRLGIALKIFWFLSFVQICPLKILAGAFLNIFILQVLDKLSGKKCSRNRGISCPWSLESQISNLKKLGHPVQICPQNFGKFFSAILNTFCLDMCSNAIIHLSRKFYGPSCYSKNVQICPENFCPLFRFAPMHKNPKFLVIDGSSTINTIRLIIFEVVFLPSKWWSYDIRQNCQNFLIFG